MKVVISLNPNQLTPDKTQKSLQAINLIEENGSGKIKGGACTDGRPQQKNAP